MSTDGFHARFLDVTWARFQMDDGLDWTTHSMVKSRSILFSVDQNNHMHFNSVNGLNNDPDFTPLIIHFGLIDFELLREHW